MKFKKIFLGLVIMAGAFVLIAPSLMSERVVRRRALWRAEVCMRDFNKVSFDDISWIVLDTPYIPIFTDSTIEQAQGWYSTDRKTIYVARDYANNIDVLTHEAIHALGVVGHPDEPFRRCGLQADQISDKLGR